MASILSVAPGGDATAVGEAAAPRAPSPEYLAWRASQRRRRHWILATRLLLLAVFLALWELLARTHVVNPLLTSYPSALWPAFVDLLRNGGLVGHAWATLQATIIGFALSMFLGIAIYVILWWLAFFTMLPMGAQSLHEADEPAPPGVERGAPKSHRLRLKALLATAIAAVAWLGVAWAVSVDLFGVRGPH